MGCLLCVVPVTRGVIANVQDYTLDTDMSFNVLREKNPLMIKIIVIVIIMCHSGWQI